MEDTVVSSLPKARGSSRGKGQEVTILTGEGDGRGLAPSRTYPQ
jgi:hypothetical protein